MTFLFALFYIFAATRGAYNSVCAKAQSNLIVLACILCIRAAIMKAETIMLAFGFDRPAGNIAPYIHRTPIAGCAFERQRQTGLRSGFFLLFSLLSLTIK